MAWAGVPVDELCLDMAAVRRVFEGRHRAGQAPPPAFAAALVAVHSRAGRPHVVLIRRAAGLAHNPGEMAFPGGRVEPGEGVVEAALREADEELALPPAAVEVLGWLDPVVARSTGATVTPVVGLVAARPMLVPAPAEVEEVFDVALADLLVAARQEVWDGRPMYFFDLGEDTVWGMTARVLHQLLSEVVAAHGFLRARLGATRDGSPGILG
jgi:8-oxo-dGTP pyrophosphatase MutT (NUDIX family)